MYEEEFLRQAWQVSLKQANLDLTVTNPALPRNPCYIPAHKSVFFGGALIQAAVHSHDTSLPRKLFIRNGGTGEITSHYEPEGTPEARIVLPVLYDQTDIRWANYPLHDGKTLGNWGCLLVAYNMLAAYWGLTDLEPHRFADLAFEKGAMYRQYVVSMGLARMYTKVESHGWMIRGYQLEKRMRQWLDKGIPVPARVDFKPATPWFEQHWILVTGYTEDSWLAADPNGGDLINVNERYGVKGRDILEGLFFTLKD